jgi:Domain of unknown function (DUF5679)
MLKRIFWLALIALGGWLLWSLWRQRQEAYHATIPQFAPIAPAAPPAPSIPPASTSAAPAEAAPEPTPQSAPAATPAQPPQPAPVDSNGAGPATSTPDGADVGATAAPVSADALGTVIGYCTRCREKRPIRDAHEELTENGRRAARGTCPVCGGNMYTFLKREPAGE